jgi:hypothetical protein
MSDQRPRNIEPASPHGKDGHVHTQLRAGALGLPEVLIQSVAVVGPGYSLLFTVPFLVSLTGVTSPLHSIEGGA